MDIQWRGSSRGKYKLYDIESYDHVGNTQHIIGRYYSKDGLLDGNIIQSNDTISTFGK